MNEQPHPSGFQVRLPLILAATLAAGMFIGQQLPRFDANISFLRGSQAGQGCQHGGADD